MREIRPYGSEGGVALTTPLLPLSVVSARRARRGAERFNGTFLFPEGV